MIKIIFHRYNSEELSGLLILPAGPETISIAVGLIALKHITGMIIEW
jgi:hypothetical protein